MKGEFPGLLVEDGGAEEAELDDDQATTEEEDENIDQVTTEEEEEDAAPQLEVVAKEPSEQHEGEAAVQALSDELAEALEPIGTELMNTAELKVTVLAGHGFRRRGKKLQPVVEGQGALKLLAPNVVLELPNNMLARVPFKTQQPQPYEIAMHLFSSAQSRCSYVDFIFIFLTWDSQIVLSW
eukprot:SAG31_NODE_4938_length_2849_cov_2.097091_4_plen_182_part_00